MRTHNQPPHHDAEVLSNTTFDADVVYLTTNEWLTIFERDVQEALGMSAAEFVRLYRAGEYEEYDPIVTLLSTSIPFYETVVAP